jgi:hypothetical protein
LNGGSRTTHCLKGESDVNIAHPLVRQSAHPFHINDQAHYDSEIWGVDRTALSSIAPAGGDWYIPSVPVGRRHRMDVRWVEQWAGGGYRTSDDELRQHGCLPGGRTPNAILFSFGDNTGSRSVDGRHLPAGRLRHQNGETASVGIRPFAAGNASVVSHRHSDHRSPRNASI